MVVKVVMAIVTSSSSSSSSSSGSKGDSVGVATGTGTNNNNAGLPGPARLELVGNIAERLAQQMEEEQRAIEAMNLKMAELTAN